MIKIPYISYFIVKNKPICKRKYQSPLEELLLFAPTSVWNQLTRVQSFAMCVLCPVINVNGNIMQLSAPPTQVQAAPVASPPVSANTVSHTQQTAQSAQNLLMVSSHTSRLTDCLLSWFYSAHVYHYLLMLSISYLVSTYHVIAFLFICQSH